MNTDLRKKMLNALSKEELIDYIIELESNNDSQRLIYIPVNEGDKYELDTPYWGGYHADVATKIDTTKMNEKPLYKCSDLDRSNIC
jgi:hypothetical protein